jgi:predicted NAD/FAD-binding protein
VLDYPQVSMRLPPDCRDTLRELASATRQPQWRIVADALAEHVERLPRDVRRRVRLAVARAVVGRKQKGSRA